MEDMVEDKKSLNGKLQPNLDHVEDEQHTSEVQYVKGDCQTQSYRISKTVALFLSYVCLGFYNGVVGPTLPDLKYRVSANYEQIGRILSSKSAGLFVGAIISGIVIDRFSKKRDLIMTISLILSGVFIIWIPYCHTYWLMGLLFHFLGQTHTLLTTVANPSITTLWANKAAGPLNLLHSGFGVGAALAPLLTEPFVSEFLDTDLVMSGNSSVNGSYHINSTGSFDSSIEIPYGIVGGLCFFIAIVFLIYFALSKYTPSLFVVKEQKNLKKLFDPSSCTGGNRVFGIQMIIFMFIYFAFVVGTERLYGKFLYSYAKDSQLQFTKKTASWLVTVYYISFTSTRFLIFIVAHFIPVQYIILTLMTGLCINAICLNVFYTSTVSLWICATLQALFEAPLFPSVVGWLNRYMPMNAMLMMVINVGASTGGLLFQWVIGYCFEYYGPRSFLYIAIGNVFGITLSFICMYVIAYKHGYQVIGVERTSPDNEEQEAEAVDLKQREIEC